MASGTSPSRRIDPRLGERPRARGRRAPERRASESPRLLRLALLAAFLLIVAGLVGPHLPRGSLTTQVLVALAVNLTLFALLCIGLLPLRAAGHRGLLLGALAAGAGALFTAVGWPAAGNVAKILFAAALGYWLAEQIESAAVVVLIAALSAVVDFVSVFWGPTRSLLEHAPAAIGYFTVVLGWPGYRASAGHTALGVSDMIFFCLYLGAARRLHLRSVATVVAMALSIVASVVIGMWLVAVPALPLLAVAFVAVNADLLLRRPRPGARRSAPARRPRRVRPPASSRTVR